MQIADYLRRMPLFSDLTADETLDVLRIAKVVRFKAGAFLCRAGEPANCMYLIDSGTASVQVTRTSRSSIEVKMLGPGQVIGELSLVDNGPRSADVVAVSDIQAYELDRVEFDRMRSRLNPAAFKMLRQIAVSVSARLRELNTFATGGLESEARKASGLEQTGRPSLGWRRFFSTRQKEEP